MTAIKVDIANLTSQAVTLRPTDLLLENADNLQARVEFAQRMSRIVRVWDAASALDTPLAQLIRDLRQNVLARDPDYKAIESSASRISEALGTDGDPLPLVEQQLALTEAPLEPRLSRNRRNSHIRRILAWKTIFRQAWRESRELSNGVCRR
jgi:hypothetical protein